MNAAFRVRILCDDSRVTELHLLVHDAFASLSINPPSGVLKETVADFRDRLQRETALVAEALDPPNTGALVGSVFCTVQADALHIGRLAVRDDFRRRGVATALLDAARAEAVQRGISRLTLSTRIALPENVALFSRYGFAVVAATCHPGFSEPTSYDMELQLARSA